MVSDKETRANARKYSCPVVEGSPTSSEQSSSILGSNRSETVSEHQLDLRESEQDHNLRERKDRQLSKRNAQKREQMTPKGE